MRSILATATVVAAIILSTGTARAEGAVIVTSSGPPSITAAAERATATSWVTFEVVDPTNTATSVWVCHIPPWGKGRECDAVPLAPSNFSDGNWQVTRNGTAWLVRSRLGYSDMDPSECYRSYFAEQPYRVTASVRNPADVELATATHTYKVNCTGIVAASSGPTRHVVYAGRSSKKSVLKYYLLDTKHVARSIRTCSYDEFNDRYYGCTREHLQKTWRTDFGYAFTWSQSWGPMGTSLCRRIGARWPEVGTRVDFYDAALRRVETRYQGFHLECKG